MTSPGFLSYGTAAAYHDTFIVGRQFLCRSIVVSNRMIGKRFFVCVVGKNCQMQQESYKKQQKCAFTDKKVLSLSGALGLAPRFTKDYARFKGTGYGRRPDTL